MYLPVFRALSKCNCHLLPKRSSLKRDFMPSKCDLTFKNVLKFRFYVKGRLYIVISFCIFALNARKKQSVIGIQVRLYYYWKAFLIRKVTQKKLLKNIRPKKKSVCFRLPTDPIFTPRPNFFFFEFPKKTGQNWGKPFC